MRRLARCAVAFPAALALLACADSPAPSAPDRPSVALARDVVAADDEPEEAFDVPIAGLTPAELDRFVRGRAVFTRVFLDATGLGPSFNAPSCANCHEEPSTGGSGDDLDEDVETHVSVGVGGSCDGLEDYGGPVIQRHTTALLKSFYPGYDTEPVPAQAGGVVARRSTPALFGFGLLEAVPASTILALADPTDANGDGVSGRASVAGGALGRFGRKATDATLLAFNAGAFQNEMGITSTVGLAEQRLVGIPFPFDPSISPTTPPELSDADLALANDFVRLLRPPPPGRATSQTNSGRLLFASIGCAMCHVPSLRTGASSVRALSNARVDAFTDLLLHDMGPGLADVCRGAAGPAEFRTEPLMGLRFRARFLHDARAATVSDAILLHGGEAVRARDRFAGLKDNQRAALIAYLATL
jgi:CxxC motif-containing protein (DUF1111 family)